MLTWIAVKSIQNLLRLLVGRLNSRLNMFIDASDHRRPFVTSGQSDECDVHAGNP